MICTCSLPTGHLPSAFYNYSIQSRRLLTLFRNPPVKKLKELKRRPKEPREKNSCLLTFRLFQLFPLPLSNKTVVADNHTPTHFDLIELCILLFVCVLQTHPYPVLLWMITWKFPPLPLLLGSSIDSHVNASCLLDNNSSALMRLKLWTTTTFETHRVLYSNQERRPLLLHGLSRMFASSPLTMTSVSRPTMSTPPLVLFVRLSAAIPRKDTRLRYRESPKGIRHFPWKVYYFTKSIMAIDISMHTNVNVSSHRE